MVNSDFCFWVNPSSSRNCCVVSGKLLNLSKPQISDWWNWDKKSKAVMCEIHLGQCLALRECQLLWQTVLGHQVRCVITVLSTFITSASADEPFGVLSAHWEMERSDRTSQKVEPRDRNGLLPFGAIISLAELGC
jgi:hypothetical protein